MPNRDMGHYSKGGAKTRESYLLFLLEFARGIGKNKPIVIFEPDSLPPTTLMEPIQAEYRLNLLKEGLELFTDKCDALVYVDVGHSNWLSPKQAANLLDNVSNDKVQGFAVNVSNYRTTKESPTFFNLPDNNGCNCDAPHGRTFPTARAAPVVVGIIFSAAALLLLQSECGTSARRWSFV